ncbi:MAG: response regulator transcription factor [Candidatus Promineifilaceae bacterium]|nr:response regulator transcription factor [Candidatus Promineifilaceae bacterium]
MGYKILIVDDEPPLLQTVRAYLEQEGYEVRTALNGRAALQEARAFKPDLVVLDIMLPELDGLEVLRQLRQGDVVPALRDVYVIMLTARADEMDRVVGLELGADDYVTKPFSPRELVARVKASLRRAGGREPAGQPSFVFRHLRLDPEGRMVWRDGQEVNLTPIEFDILQALVRHAGRVLSREQLVEQVWGVDYYGDERVVDVHIGRLRKKIEEDPAEPELIETVWGTGYRFEDEPA